MRKSFIYGLVVAVAVVILLIWWFGKPAAELAVDDKLAVESALPVKAVVAPKTLVVADRKMSNAALVVPPATVVSNVVPRPPVTAPMARTMKPVRPKAEPLQVTPGRVRRDADPDAIEPLTALKTTTERIISQLLRVQPGERFIELPLPRDFDADFAVALKNEILIYDSDSEADVDHKVEIGWLKEELRERAAAGESPTEILLAWRDSLREMADYRDGLQRQLVEIRRNDGIEKATEFATEANKMLGEHGIKPLVVPFPLGRR